MVKLRRMGIGWTYLGRLDGGCGSRAGGGWARASGGRAGTGVHLVGSGHVGVRVGSSSSVLEVADTVGERHSDTAAGLAAVLLTLFEGRSAGLLQVTEVEIGLSTFTVDVTVAGSVGGCWGGTTSADTGSRRSTGNRATGDLVDSVDVRVEIGWVQRVLEVTSLVIPGGGDTARYFGTLFSTFGEGIGVTGVVCG